MENKSRLYLVSFGNSRKYKVESADGSYSRVNEVREEVEDFLKKTFPSDGGLKFYKEPHVEDVPMDERAEYADYPELDAAAVKEIEETLCTEVRNFNDQEMLDRNAPFNEVAPEY